MVVIVPVLSALAFGARNTLTLVMLSVVDFALIIALRGSLRPFLKETRFFVIQTAVISALYFFRYGYPEGLWPGLRTSWQLLLAFTPGIILMKTVPQHKLIAALERFIPYRLAFTISTSLRFIPLLITEAKSIWEAQVLRGGRILRRDLLNPFAWPDFVHCVLVPVIVQGLRIAGEVSHAATARGFGLNNTRTHWRGTTARPEQTI